MAEHDEWVALLNEIADHAEATLEHRRLRDRAIRRAVKAQLPVQAVAEAAGLSRVHVWRIVKEEKG